MNTASRRGGRNLNFAAQCDSYRALTDLEKEALLKRYSRANISASELRRALGGVTYGDVFVELAKRGLPLPRAPQEGRETRIEAARELLFPRAS